MSHMVPEITERVTWTEVETATGTFYFPDGEAAANLGALPRIVREIEGYGARLSAAGFLDCTDWVVFPSVAEAARYLLDTYYDQADEDLSDDEREERSDLEAKANQGR